MMDAAPEHRTSAQGSKHCRIEVAGAMESRQVTGMLP